MKLPILLICLAALLVASVMAEGPMQWARSDATLDVKMRQLWDAQATWTRLYVVSALGDLPDTTNSRARLFRCPTDFEAAVGPYYGKKTAQNFSGAVGLHLQTLAEVVRATKAGDPQALAELKTRWRTDAESTSTILGTINPAWSAPAFRELLDVYLQLVDRGVALRARGDFVADIGNFEESHEVALQLGNAMTRAILSQFPARLTPGGK